MYTPDGGVRPAYAGYSEWYARQQPQWLRRKDREAEAVFRSTGITVHV